MPNEMTVRNDHKIGTLPDFRLTIVKRNHGFSSINNEPAYCATTHLNDLLQQFCCGDSYLYTCHLPLPHKRCRQARSSLNFRQTGTIEIACMSVSSDQTTERRRKPQLMHTTGDSCANNDGCINTCAPLDADFQTTTINRTLAKTWSS